MKNYLLTLLALGLAPIANAFCDGGYPNISVENEAKEAEFVVIGTPYKRQVVVDYETDPRGYEAELFQVKISEVLSGTPPRYTQREYLTLYNFNSSSRFVMLMNTPHLLFVSTGSDGYYINSCGNSSTITTAGESLEKLKVRQKIKKTPTTTLTQ